MFVFLALFTFSRRGGAKSVTIGWTKLLHHFETMVETTRFVGIYVGESKIILGCLQGGALHGFRNHPQYQGLDSFLVGRTVVQWHPFSFLLVAAPLKMVFPKKGSFVFLGSLNN